MRKSPWILLGAASQISCFQALQFASIDRALRSVDLRGGRCNADADVNERTGSGFWSGRWAHQQREHLSQQTAPVDEDSKHPSRWWRSKKRRAALQAEMVAAEVIKSHHSRSNVRVRKHVVLALGVLRRLRRWLSVIVDITTLKRLRQIRQARQVSSYVRWQLLEMPPVVFSCCCVLCAVILGKLCCDCWCSMRER